MTFATSRGRGVHTQRQHKDWNDQQLASKISNAKTPWSAEESALLARSEARLTIEGARFMNQALHACHPTRTLDAIKGHRRYAHYKESVERALNEMRLLGTSSSSPGPTTRPCSDDLKDSLATSISNNLNELPSAGYNIAHLRRICCQAKELNEDSLFEEISLYVREIFPVSRQQRRHGDPSHESASNRKMRRAEYARVQRAWSKNPCKALRSILKGKEAAAMPDKAVMAPYWEAVFTASCDSSPHLTQEGSILEELWKPVEDDEVRRAFPGLGSSTGPDLITVRQLRAVPVSILKRIFCIFMLCGRVPEWLLESRTVFIPKKDNATDPADFRPITVSSVLTRSFHKVLSNRLVRTVSLDRKQRAFLPVDGCAENIFSLDVLLRYHRQNFKPVHLASLDIAKAFDSVSHKTIFASLRAHGVPQSMVAYIKYVYDHSSTHLVCGNESSKRIRPTCGVKQGDPLSPMLFNIVIDGMLREIPAHVGVDLGTNHYNGFAFADDVIFVASTAQGLQLTLDHAVGYLAQCGLNINATKSFSIALRNVPHEKKSVVDSRIRFQVAGRTLPALKRTDEWKYLGIPFTPEGRSICRPEHQLKAVLNKLTKAPLKPQQRLFALRTVALPGLYHLLTLGSTFLSTLKKCDILVRGAVRKWLTLPHDVTKAYFHANAKDGGLSIPSLRWLMPLHRMKRLKALVVGGQCPTTFISCELGLVERRLRDGPSILDSKSKIERRWASLLHSSVDGKSLASSNDVPQQHQWVTDGSRFLSGRDFINTTKLRINALPTKSRSSRGRTNSRLCRAGCNETETLNHILQTCHRTHGPRVARHNAVVSYIKRAMATKYDYVEEEPHIRTNAGLSKPDLIAVRGSAAIVADAQVVGEQSDLAVAYARKKEKYSSLLAEIRARYGVKDVSFTSITLSCRGVWSRHSVDDLLRSNILRRSELKVLSSRVLVGGMACYNVFSRSTAVRRGCLPRSGIG